MRPILVVFLCACASATAAPPGTPAAVPVTLPGATGGIGFDDLRFAPGLRKVIAPAGRSGNLALIDPETREITTVSGFSKSDSFGGGHGEGTTSADEGGGFLFAIDRNARRLDVVDPATRAIVAYAPLAGGPDYVRWVAATHEVWVTEPNAKQIEIFTLPASGTPTPAVQATIKVDNGPESLVIDTTRGRAYTHRWDDRSHAIDLKSRSIVATWANGCKGSRGIALDEPRGLLFVGCDEGKAVVLDVAHDGKMLSSLSPGVNGVDVIAYNPVLGHLYLPGEDSKTMAILGVSAKGTLTTLATVATAAGAHCVTQDDRGGAWVCAPETGQLLYFQDTLPASLAAPPGLNGARIEELTAAKGKLDEKAGVFKVSVPRTDLAITAAGVKITPPMGLTTWAAFKKVGQQTMVMGDMVLLEDQVNPVMSTALDAGLEVTALHNHFAGDSPRVMFMHIGGMGDEEKLAGAVGKVFAKIQETSGGKGETLRADIDPAKSTLDPRKIDAVLGKPGDLKDGVYKITIGRETKMHGEPMGNTMGVNTWAAFAGSDDKAVVDGDFAMLEIELQPVLKALRGAGIHIVAIHQHMTGETPRILFLHYWGIGRTADLAKGLKAALDTQRAP